MISQKVDSIILTVNISGRSKGNLTFSPFVAWENCSLPLAWSVCPFSFPSSPCMQKLIQEKALIMIPLFNYSIIALVLAPRT